VGPAIDRAGKLGPRKSGRLTLVKLALVGASGFVGSRVLAHALERGHDVTGIVRDISRLRPRAGLAPLESDVLDPERVAAAVTGHDAVISCFHPGGHDPGANPTLYRDIVEGTRAMIDGVKRSGVRRFVYVGGCGSLFVREGVMLVDDPESLSANMREGRPAGTYPMPREGPPMFDIPLAARMAFYLFERELELEWSFLSPSRFLGDFGGPSGNIRRGGSWLLFEADGTPAKVDVADLAIALIEEVEEPQHIRGHFTVASGP
jgi:putative NADH-flavin reductase